MHLLDTSILIGIADLGSTHHRRCDAWLQAWAHAGWATCPIVENGMLRIMSGPAYAGGPYPLESVVEVLQSMRTRPGYFFVPDDISSVDSEFIRLDLVTGHQQITDAYLLGLCRKHCLKLVTTDRRIEPELAPGEGIVELI